MLCDHRNDAPTTLSDLTDRVGEVPHSARRPWTGTAAGALTSRHAVGIVRLEAAAMVSVVDNMSVIYRYHEPL